MIFPHLETMSELQSQLAELRRCPFCRAELEFSDSSFEFAFWQCAGCDRIFILPAKRELIG